MSSDTQPVVGSDMAIQVDDLWKHFQIYAKPHHRLLQGLFRGRRQFFHEFCALRAVSFEVKKGEVVGIVGRNGCGKSTLLQLICGTMSQSAGTVKVNGRIAALLELGTGFNSEFTGRENVYINGAILGLSREEIDARFESIADFAEIGDFIDQPVKTYSSGMMVRLAFAVAINVDPEILVVDEALSVGDERFQRKCFARIETIRKKGATILFVSHAASTVVELCDRAILLDAGEILAIGSPKKIIGYYQKLLYAPEAKRLAIREQISSRPAVDFENIDFLETRIDHHLAAEKQDENKAIETFDPALKPTSTIEYEQLGAKIESPMILTLDGLQANNLIRGNSYIYKYTVHFTEDAHNVRFGMLIKSPTGTELGGSESTQRPSQGIPTIEAQRRAKVAFQFTCNLTPGLYFLNAGVIGARDGGETYLHRCLDFCMFRVLPEVGMYATSTIDFLCVPRIEIV